MTGTEWIPATVAIGTVIANAAITYAAVARHERAIASMLEDVQALKTEVAVLKERTKEVNP